MAIGVVNSKQCYYGFNSAKSHPGFVYHKGGVELSSHHAEFDLLKRVPQDVLPSLKVYVCRVNKHGELTMAKPCGACEEQLRRAGVRQIFYTDYSGDWVELFLN